MVDFQERDTRRSVGGGGDEDDETDESDGSDDESSAEDDQNAVEESEGSTVDDGESAVEESDESTVEDGDGATVGDHGHHGSGDHEDDHGSDHDHHAADRASVSAAILTISSSRSIEEDASGDAIVEVFEAEGHEVATRELVNDDYDGVQSAVDALVSRGDVDVVVTSGGTGVAPEDVTVEAVRPLFEKELPGFGELFRDRSREEIGARAIATRAVAGVADGVPVFCLPGSEDAVRLGTAEVIAPVVGHLVGLSRPHEVERQR